MMTSYIVEERDPKDGWDFWYHCPDTGEYASEECARLQMELERKKSEAYQYRVVKIIREVLPDDPVEGKDICYGCGKVQASGTMKDLTEDGFDIYCDKCRLEYDKNLTRDLLP